MRWMMGLGALMLIAACASQPQQPPQPPQPEPAQAAAVPANAAPASVAPVTEEDIAKAAKSYKVMEKNGEQVYCKREAAMGTRLPSTVCLTEAQLVDSIRRTREVTDAMRNRSVGPCGGQGMACN